MAKSLRLLLLALCLAPAACDRAPKDQANGIGGEGRVEWIDPKTIQPGPIRRDALSDEQMASIRALQSTFAEVDGQTVEQWVDNFKRDVDPDRDLRIWERMAKAYRAYCAGRKLALDVKKEVYRVVLLRSMASEQDVLERAKLKVLSREDAIEIMKGY